MKTARRKPRIPSKTGVKGQLDVLNIARDLDLIESKAIQAEMDKLYAGFEPDVKKHVDKVLAGKEYIRLYGENAGYIHNLSISNRTALAVYRSPEGEITDARNFITDEETRVFLITVLSGAIKRAIKRYTAYSFGEMTKEKQAIFDRIQEVQMESKFIENLSTLIASED